MSRYPNIWSLKDLVHLANTANVKVNVGDKWVPARPAGWPSLRCRCVCAWLVFTGKADAVIWPEDKP